jgi:K+-sensing histidine kinase KdpD
MKSIVEKINQASIKLLKPLTLHATYKTIVEEALEIIHADDGRIVLYNKETKSFDSAYKSDPKAVYAKIRKNGFTMRCLKENKAFVIQKKELQRVHPRIIDSGVHSIVFIPLAYKKRPVGILYIRSYKKNTFTKYELEALKLFGSIASLAIHKTQLYTQTKKALQTSELFIAMASHELKTPLTAISVYASLLKKKSQQLHTQENEWITNLITGINHLSGLVDEMLTASNIKTGRLAYQWQRNSIKDIISASIINAQTRFPEHLFIPHFPRSDLFVYGDKNKLLQVVTNILNNAAKFSPKEKPITLKIYKKEQQITISITDEGKGISSTELPRIFDKFYKANGNYREGMGLGLYLVKEIIRAHKGNIDISSQLHKGTTVTLFLPNL